MNKRQLQRTMPGFIRVEVLLDEEQYGAQPHLDPVPVRNRPTLDPNPCCQMSMNDTASPEKRPANPGSDKLVLWEVGIQALGVRKMPEPQTPPPPSSDAPLDWVVLQRGPNVNDPNLAYGDYWSGKDGYFQRATGLKSASRPAAMSFSHINNQGGWMATRHQIWEWHTQICPGGFLPPYEAPHFRFDGLDARNVEWWSGGMHLSTKRHACNLQRIISLDPQRFAKQLIYHSANNKQRQLHWQAQRFVKANDLLGQLNTVQFNADREMTKELFG